MVPRTDPCRVILSNYAGYGPDLSRYTAGLEAVDSPEVDAITVSGTNIFVGGSFTNIGGLTRVGLAKVSALGAGLVDPSWNMPGTNSISGYFPALAVGNSGADLVSGGSVAAVSALNDTPAGAGTATNRLTMVTNPSPVFKFTAAAYSVREGQGSIVVAVRKFGAGTGMVNYATPDLTATGGQDYQTRSGTLNFSANDKFQNLIITIADDLQPEGDERFAVTLTNASVGASIAGPATAIVTIVDNDIVGLSDSLTAARTRSIVVWASTSSLHRRARKRRQWFPSTPRRPVSLTSTTARSKPASASAVAL